MPPRAFVVTSKDELPTALGTWREFRDAHATPTSWSDPGRFAAELEVSGSGVRPYVLRLEGPSGTCAMLVGRLATVTSGGRFAVARRLAPRLRQLAVVYGGVTTDGGEEGAAALVEHLRAALDGGELDRVRFNHLPRAADVSEALRSAGARVLKEEPHWRTNLVPGSPDAVRAGLSGRRRKELRRLDRDLEARFGGSLRLRAFREPEEVDELVRGTAELSARTYQAGLGVGFRDTPLWRALLTADARGGRLRGFWLEAEGRPIAFAVGSRHGSAYFGDFRGFDPSLRMLSPGKALHVRVLEALAEEGCDAYDYGFGENEFKRTFGTDSWPEATLDWYGKGLRPRAARLVESTSEGTFGLVKRSLGRLGLLDAAKRSRRRRLERGRSEP